MSTNIGESIRKRREELGYTQEELAKKLGYKSKSTITKIEMGINDITQSKIFAFAQALDVPTSFLMGWEDDKTYETIVYNYDLESIMSHNKRYISKLLGYIFKKLRISNDLTEKSIALRADVSIEDYINIETPGDDINYETIIKIIKAFNINYDYLFGFLHATDISLRNIDDLNISKTDKDKIKETIIEQMYKDVQNINDGMLLFNNKQ